MPAQVYPGGFSLPFTPFSEDPNLRVPRAPALSVLLDSFLLRRQDDTRGSEQETLLNRIL